MAIQTAFGYLFDDLSVGHGTSSRWAVYGFREIELASLLLGWSPYDVGFYTGLYLGLFLEVQDLDTDGAQLSGLWALSLLLLSSERCASKTTTGVSEEASDEFGPTWHFASSFLPLCACRWLCNGQGSRIRGQTLSPTDWQTPPTRNN